jgi:hypothetical protein
MAANRAKRGNSVFSRMTGNKRESQALFIKKSGVLCKGAPET